MKFIKTVVLSLTLIASSAYSMGTEELCNLHSTRNVELKEFFNKHPRAFPLYLEENEKSKETSKFKERLRERAFWVYNRKNMPDEDIQRLSFIRCLIENQ